MAQLEKLNDGAKLSLNREEMWMVAYAIEAGIDREHERIGDVPVKDESAVKRLAFYKSLKSLMVNALTNQ